MNKVMEDDDKETRFQVPVPLNVLFQDSNTYFKKPHPH